MTARVAEIGADDWRLFRELRRAALADSAERFGSSLAEWSGAGDVEPRWRARLEAAELNLITYVDDQPVGMASALVDDVVDIISVWVAPSARGHGVGDTIVEHIVTWRGAHHAELPLVLSVKPDNEPAIALYARHGFVRTGLSPDGDDEDQMTYQPRGG